MKKREVFIQNKLRVAITNKCNLSCFYCHNEGQCFDNHKLLSLSYVKQLTNWIASNNVKLDVINITGGEPLLHPDLKAIIEEFLKVSPKIRLNTNATMLTKGKINYYSQKNINLVIGLDSVKNKETKPNLISTNKKTSFFDILKYACQKLNVRFNVVVSMFNINELEEMVDILKDLGASSIRFICLHDFDSRKTNNNDKYSIQFKTNQPICNYYEGFKQKIITKAGNQNFDPNTGMTNIYYGGLKITFCDDVCKSASCAESSTILDSNGRLMICQKNQITSDIDFSQDFDSVLNALNQARKKMCSAKEKRFLYKN